MARSPQEKNLLPQIGGALSTTFSNSTEVAQWVTPRCSLPQPPTDDGVRNGRFNWLAGYPYPHGPLNASCTVQIGAASAGMR